MRASFATLSIVLLLAGTAVDRPAAAETLRVAGTGGALGMLQRIVAEYAAVSGVQLELVPSLGSKGAIRATADGVIDISVSARPLDTDEAARGLTAIPFARTAFVLVTSNRNPNSLNSIELAAILKATNPKWADGSIVRAVVGLSSSLGIISTAEGVETKEQLASLTSEGCNEFQGFLYSKPQPAGEIQQLLSAQVRPAAAVA